MSSSSYADKVVNEFMEKITDHVFLNIQNNEHLMREYQSAVHESSLMEVNTAIGKKVKEVFNLKDSGECNQPNSWLIKSYTKHVK